MIGVDEGSAIGQPGRTKQPSRLMVAVRLLWLMVRGMVAADDDSGGESHSDAGLV